MIRASNPTEILRTQLSVDKLITVLSDAGELKSVDIVKSLASTPRNKVLKYKLVCNKCGHYFYTDLQGVHDSQPDRFGYSPGCNPQSRCSNKCGGIYVVSEGDTK